MVDSSQPQSGAAQKNLSGSSAPFSEKELRAAADQLRRAYDYLRRKYLGYPSSFAARQLIIDARKDVLDYAEALRRRAPRWWQVCR